MAAAETARLIASLELKDKLTPGVNTATRSLGRLDSGMGKLKRGAGAAGKALAGIGAVTAVGLTAAIKGGLEDLAALENDDVDDVRTLIADEADGLYARKVMLPLLATAASSSQPTPTTSSTSPTPGSGTEPRDPSSPSSISTIPTVATATTSKRRAGGSSSSRSSVTAA